MMALPFTVIGCVALELGQHGKHAINDTDASTPVRGTVPKARNDANTCGPLLVRVNGSA